MGDAHRTGSLGDAEEHELHKMADSQMSGESQQKCDALCVDMIRA